MPSNETGSGATTSGGIRLSLLSSRTCRTIRAFGWGIVLWGGTVSGAVTTTLNGAINAVQYN